jgi:ABC-2 type transport system permease protein
MGIKKLFLIAMKDLRLIFRDKSALVLMLVAPFVLTIGMGAVTGRFSGNTQTSIANIPVVIVSQDEGPLGEILIDVFQSTELGTLLEPQVLESYDLAKELVDTDKSSAAIYVPQGFSESVYNTQKTHKSDEILEIEFYANPTSPTGAGVIKTILESFINRVEVNRVFGEVSISQLVDNRLISPEMIPGLQAQLAQESETMVGNKPYIKINQQTQSGQAVKFDILAYMAPGMALMFLMFTVTYGSRSLLVENRSGTLPRMLISPTQSGYILGGKVMGILFTSIAQLVILIGGTSLLFQLKWGDPLGVALLILAAAFAATGWGMLIGAFLKTPGQIAVVGSAVMLIFGVLGGSFFDISLLPSFIQVISKITPNAWGIQGFLTLSMGGTLENISASLFALVIMGTILFTISAIWISQRGLARK